jgi:hypothetical protein
MFEDTFAQSRHRLALVLKIETPPQYIENCQLGDVHETQNQLIVSSELAIQK